MTYQDKVQASKKVLEAIKALAHDEVFEFIYGTDYDYTTKAQAPRVFNIKAYTYKSTGDTEYSIHETKIFGRGMNVDKITPTSLKLYTYDMFGSKTTYTMPLYEMSIVNPINDTISTDKATVLEGI
jgi:hypothetical protein